MILFTELFTINANELEMYRRFVETGDLKIHTLTVAWNYEEISKFLKQFEQIQINVKFNIQKKEKLRLLTSRKRIE